MPRADYKRCKDCGRLAAEVGQLSHTRLCVACSIKACADNLIELDAKRGPHFRYWHRRLAESLVRLDATARDAQTAQR